MEGRGLSASYSLGTVSSEGQSSSEDLRTLQDFWEVEPETDSAPPGLRDVFPRQSCVLPNRLAHEAVRVLGGEGGEQRPCGDTFLQFDQFRVGAELRTLVDVQDPDGDSGGGLAGQVNPTSQGHLVLGLHRQREGPCQLIVDGLDRREEPE